MRQDWGKRALRWVKIFQQDSQQESIMIRLFPKRNAGLYWCQMLATRCHDICHNITCRFWKSIDLSDHCWEEAAKGMTALSVVVRQARSLGWVIKLNHELRYHRHISVLNFLSRLLCLCTDCTTSKNGSLAHGLEGPCATKVREGRTSHLAIHFTTRSPLAKLNDSYPSTPLISNIKWAPGRTWVFR